MYPEWRQSIPGEKKSRYKKLLGSNQANVLRSKGKTDYNIVFEKKSKY